MIQEQALDLQSKYTTYMATIVDCVRDGTPGKGKVTSPLISGSSQSANSRNKSIKAKTAAWWNEECDQLIQQRKEAYLNFRVTPNSDNLRSYCKSLVLTKKRLRQLKKDHFLEFCSSLNKHTSMSFIWNKVRALNNSYTRNLKSNEYSEKSMNSIKSSIDELCPPWSEVPKPDFSNAARVDLFESSFSMEELNWAINKGRTKSCPGPDGIDYVILKKLTHPLKICLLNLLNEIYLSGTFPKEWHQFNVFFIPKKDSGKFRPISLAQTSLKVLERMLCQRLH